MKSIDQATADYATLLVNLATQLMSATAPCQCSDTSNCAADFATALIAEARRQLLPEPVKASCPAQDSCETTGIGEPHTARLYKPASGGYTCAGCISTQPHTTDCKFEHFLAYSGHHNSPEAVKALLREAFDAAL